MLFCNPDDKEDDLIFLPCRPAERLVGAGGTGGRVPGGAVVHGRSDFCRRPALHAQPGAARQPAQPGLVHGPGSQRPAVHAAPPGGRALPLPDQQQPLPCGLLLFLRLPPLHE